MFRCNKVLADQSLWRDTPQEPVGHAPTHVVALLVYVVVMVLYTAVAIMYWVDEKPVVTYAVEATEGVGVVWASVELDCTQCWEHSGWVWKAEWDLSTASEVCKQQVIV